MDRMKAIDNFQLNDNGVFDKYVDPISGVKMNTIVNNRQFNLRLNF